MVADGNGMSTVEKGIAFCNFMLNKKLPNLGGSALAIQSLKEIERAVSLQRDGSPAKEKLPDGFDLQSFRERVYSDAIWFELTAFFRDIQVSGGPVLKARLSFSIDHMRQWASDYGIDFYKEIEELNEMIERKVFKVDYSFLTNLDGEITLLNYLRAEGKYPDYALGKIAALERLIEEVRWDLSQKLVGLSNLENDFLRHVSDGNVESQLE